MFAAFPKVSERRNARMRMPPDAWKRSSLGIEQIEKDEGFETLAEVRRAHQAGDGSVRLAVRPMDDLTWALLSRRGGFGHEEFPLPRVIVARCVALAWPAVRDPTKLGRRASR